MNLKFTFFVVFFAQLYLSAFAQSSDTLTIEQQLAASQRYNFFVIPNQSGDFIRMPCRGASTDVDAVFYNPAGTAFLPDGFHFSITNQSLRQKTSVSSNYQYMNEVPTKFEGLVSAPVFPSFYGVYKNKKLAFSIGFNPVAGGGGAEFKGLPVTERNIADIIPNLHNIFKATTVDSANSVINAYNVDFRSTGVAFFAGAQLGVAYKLNKMVSFAAGVRYVFARITSQGHTRNLQIYPAAYGDWITPGDYCRYVKSTVSPLYGAILNLAAEQLDANTGDREIDVIQNGNGFTPMFGVHIEPFDGLDIGLKYELNTDVEITTHVQNGKDGRVISDPDSAPLFIDGSSVRSDLPAILEGAVHYKVLNKKLTLATGGRYLFTKNANYNGREKLVNKNYYEVETAIAYNLNPDLIISGGFTFGNWNVQPQYQTDVDFWTDSYSYALGGQYLFSEKVEVNVGVLYSKFAKQDIEYTHTPVPSPAPLQPFIPSVEPSEFTNQYQKNALIFAIGADIHLYKKKNK